MECIFPAAALVTTSKVTPEGDGHHMTHAQRVETLMSKAWRIHTEIFSFVKLDHMQDYIQVIKSVLIMACNPAYNLLAFGR